MMKMFSLFDLGDSCMGIYICQNAFACSLSINTCHITGLEMQLESPRILGIKNELLMHRSG